MEPKLSPLQNKYIKYAEKFLIKQNITEEVYDIYMNRYVEDINKVDIMNQQRKQLTSIYENLKSLFDVKSTQGLTQADYDIEQMNEEIRYEEEQKEKRIRAEEARKKLQDEFEMSKNIEDSKKKLKDDILVDKLIILYNKKKRENSMTLKEFENEYINAILKKYKDLSKTEQDEKMARGQELLNIFKTKIAVNELYPSTSSAVEIPKVKDITFSRFKLNIESVEEYREKRKNQTINGKRNKIYRSD